MYYLVITVLKIIFCLVLVGLLFYNYSYYTYYTGYLVGGFVYLIITGKKWKCTW